MTERIDVIPLARPMQLCVVDVIIDYFPSRYSHWIDEITSCEAENAGEQDSKPRVEARDSTKAEDDASVDDDDQADRHNQN